MVVAPGLGHPAVSAYIYKCVEFGGGYHLVLVDEDWSFSPKNYADGIPRPDWKYYQPYLPGCTYFWAWDTAYLNLVEE